MKTNRLIWAAMSVAALLGIDARPAHGQFIRGTSNPYSQSSGGVFTSGSTSAYGGGSTRLNGFPFTGKFIPSSGSNPYKSAPHLNVFTPHLNGGYITGGAGTYYKNSQNPIYPTATGAGGFQPDVPRLAFDRWVVERDRQAANTPDAQKKQGELLRNLSNPSAAEISSGAALNVILEGLEPFTAKLSGLPPTDIDEAFLKRLNFTRGAGSIGLLRQQGKLEWPALLANLSPPEETAKVRQQIETRFLDAYNQVAAAGPAEPDNLKALFKSIDLLKDMASGRAQSMTFAEIVEVKRYLKSLEDSVTFLKQPDAADWLPGKRKAPSKTLQELVLRMLEGKVRFAPALVGNDGAYLTMHRALANLYAQAAR